ncbi:MAG: fatty acid desaturase [Gammaproteobacteria bacterium]|jgi:stearoyl-CoA desaturase (delta-9 desaturase)|nr:fatty acid desaturase [Gammaproteobacteria bacterium]
MLYGLLNLSFWGYVVATLILTHITIIGVTIYLHRYQAHRGLELHPLLSHFFRFWLWLTTGMVTKEWAAIHRKHHAKCETAEDPHSPQVKGLKKVLWEGAELYQEEAKNQETLERYGQGTPDDWLERNIYTRHSAKGIVLMLLIDLLLFGIPGITIWALQMAWIPFHAAGVINGIGHYWGYRNFECKDAARNIFPWAFWIGGEELHNNHHTFATSAKFSVKWWEFDIGWGYIKLFSLLKLAKVKRLPPKVKIVPNKTCVDIETVKAIITGRFQVMSHYSTEVLLPVLQAEKQKAGKAADNLFKKAKSLLIRDNNLINQKNRQQLTHLLEKNETLRLVYQQGLKLQEIWARGTATQRELLEALQTWCKQAEAAGIESLRNFASHIKGYTLATE